MFGDETTQTAAATTESVYHVSSFEYTWSSEASTVFASTRNVDNRLSTFVIFRTVCFSIVFTVGVACSLLVLTLITRLQNRKQVYYGAVCFCRRLMARFACAFACYIALVNRLTTRAHALS
jgi:hypothetical protein